MGSVQKGFRSPKGNELLKQCFVNRREGTFKS